MMQPNEPKDPHALAAAARFANLKTRLLLERLNETPESEIHALIIRQSHEAALLAGLSGYPLLAFPCLFEERALTATEQARRQARLYWRKTQPPAPARAVSQNQARWRSAHSALVGGRKFLDPGYYLILMRQHHPKSCRPRLALSARSAVV